LRLAPLPFDVEMLPDFPVATFNKVEAIRIWMNGDVDGKLPQNAAAVPSDESEESGLNLKTPSASAIIDRQMEQQMAVNDVGVGFALSAPYARQPTRNAPSKEPFVESFTDFGEKFAVRIIKDHRSRPMARGMGNQWKADGSRMIDCFDEVGRLI
jgi:hypothetical protein